MVFHIARGGNKYNRWRMSFERWNIIEASIRLGSGTTFYFSVTNEDYKELMTSTNLKVLLVSKANLSSFKIYFKKDYFWKPLLGFFWNRITLKRSTLRIYFLIMILVYLIQYTCLLVLCNVIFEANECTKQKSSIIFV